MTELKSSKWRKRKKEITRGTVSHIALLMGSLLFIFPFYWMISTSLKPDSQIYVFPPVWIPNPLQWSNYSRAVSFIPFFTYLLNTLYLCGMNIVGVLISSSLVAYGFSRIRWYGRDFFFIVLLSTLMIPYQTTMIPLFIIFRKIGWIGTYKPLWVPSFFGVAFYIFLLRQFFMTIPSELSDAAKIDGASELVTFFRILLPLVKPALAVVGLFSFLATWHNFLGPLIYLDDQAKYTLSLGLQQFLSLHGAEWSLLMAGSTLMTVPIVIIFFFAQRTFIQGIALTGLKG